MGKQALYCIFILMMACSAWAQDIESGLEGWWKLDGDALDSSGNEHHGTLVGDAHFIEDGVYGGSLSLDGSGDYVTITGYKGVLANADGVQQPFTVAAWVRTTNSGDRTIASWGTNTNKLRVDWRLFEGRLRVEHGSGNRQGDTALNDGEWHHVALTMIEGATVSYPDVTLWLDGADDTRSGTDPDEFAITSGVDMAIGYRATAAARYFLGDVDEVRIYSRVLTADEMAKLALFGKAHNPSPADGTMGVNNPLLTWEPRGSALFHDVYLGTDPNLGPDDLVSPRWMASVYWHVPGLEPGTTYYWRIDEIEPDGTMFPGDVWTFFASPLEAWDAKPMDGEPYMDPNVTLTWATGATGLSHDVYFGANETEVAEGTGETFKGNTLENSYVTGDLELDTTYYWRVDEVDAGGAKITGHVWSFKTLPEIPVTDESLVAWWTFDEGFGTRVVDWSGHGANGDFVGSPQWVDGYEGGALEFAGVSGEHIDVQSYDGVLGMQDRTVTAWIKTAGLGDIISWGPNTDTQKWIFRVQEGNGNPGTIRVEVAGGRIVGWTDMRDNEWHHVACILASEGAPTVSDIRLYVDSVQEKISDSLVVDVNTAGGRNVWIGDGHHDRPFPGLIDDLRVYNKALTQDELDLAMRIDPLRAWRPNPADSSTADIRAASPVTWSRGDMASQHDLYFGTDEVAVAVADTTDTTGIYRGRLGATSHMPIEGLALGQEYFWRVDEVNSDGSITPGRVWSFVVADFVFVDEFETYSNDVGQRVFEAWIDGIGFTLPEPGNAGNGTGAAVGHDVWDPASPHFGGLIMETGIVQSGYQSMPLGYNNENTPWYSRADRAFVPAQDWTIQGVTDLSLWVRAEAAADYALFGDDQISMSGGGNDIWNTADQFRFAYKVLNGNGSMTARVTGVGPGTNAWCKGGVMIRQDLQGGSVNAMIAVTGGNGDGGTFQWRPVADEASDSSRTLTGIAPPYWVRLVREGNTFTGYLSADGENWEQEGTSSIDVPMTDPVFIGLGVTSHQEGELRGYSFDNISSTGDITGAWQMEDVGIVAGTAHVGPINGVADLYAIVRDSLGGSAKVKHPNPAMVVTPAWDNWLIPLDSLTGVNLARVNQLSLSIGDPDSAVPDGTGKIFVDEIRLIPPAPVDPNDPNAVQ